MDVDVKFTGFEFVRPLAFIETPREVIPFDGFSDPPGHPGHARRHHRRLHDGAAEPLVRRLQPREPEPRRGLRCPVRRPADEHVVPLLHARESVATRPSACSAEASSSAQAQSPTASQIFEGAIEFGAACSVDLRRRVRQRLGDGRAVFQDRRLRLRASPATSALARRGRGARHRLGAASSSTSRCATSRRAASASGTATLSHRDRRDAVQHHYRDQLHEEVRRRRQRPDAARAARRPARRATSADWNAVLRGVRMRSHDGRESHLDGPAPGASATTAGCASPSHAARGCATTMAATRSGSWRSSRHSANWPAAREHVPLVRRRVRWRARRRSGVPEAPADPGLWSPLLPGDTRVGRTRFRITPSATCTCFQCAPLLKFSRAGVWCGRGCRHRVCPSIDDAAGPLAPFAAAARHPQSDRRLAVVPTTSWPALKRTRRRASDGHVVVWTHGRSKSAAGRTASTERFLPGVSLLHRDLAAGVRIFRRTTSESFAQAARLRVPRDLVWSRRSPATPAPTRRRDRPRGGGVEAAAIAGNGRGPRVVPRGELPEKPPVCPGTSYDSRRPGGSARDR